MIVFNGGPSLITNQTHIGPIIVSNKKKRFTSAAGINLGAIVTKTNGIATQRIHIKGTIIKSFSIKAKLSMKKRAKVATNNLPPTAAGTKFFDFNFIIYSINRTFSLIYFVLTYIICSK